MQDREGCLWQDWNLEALAAAGFDIVEHPKHSPDLNAIEGWWNRLRQRLEETEPEYFEDRPEFLKRLRRTVDWINIHCQVDGVSLCRNQKERARSVLKLKGAKCRW